MLTSHNVAFIIGIVFFKKNLNSTSPCLNLFSTILFILSLSTSGLRTLFLEIIPRPKACNVLALVFLPFSFLFNSSEIALLNATNIDDLLSDISFIHSNSVVVFPLPATASTIALPLPFLTKSYIFS